MDFQSPVFFPIKPHVNYFFYNDSCYNDLPDITNEFKTQS